MVNLPKNNVLFVSNHQTYFADVAAMYHVFCAVNNGYMNTIKNPVYLLNPKVDFYYVAAEETMNKGILTRIFKLAGAVTVKELGAPKEKCKQNGRFKRSRKYSESAR